MIAPTLSRPPKNEANVAAAHEAEELVKRFQATGDVALRNAVIKQYWGCLVARANSHPAKTHVPVEELVSYGSDGMFNAIRLWKPDSNVSFGHYLKQKIYFAIQEGLRSMCQSTRTQRERGEVKQFNRLSSVGIEGARDHSDFEELERAEEADDAIRRVPMTWTERLVARLTWRDGWTPAEIADPLSLLEIDVKRMLRALLARLGDGSDEVDTRKASLTAAQRYRAKKSLEASNREGAEFPRVVDALLDDLLVTVDRLLADGALRPALRMLLAFANQHAIGRKAIAGKLRKRVIAEARQRGFRLWVDRCRVVPRGWWRIYPNGGKLRRPPLETSPVVADHDVSAAV